MHHGIQIESLKLLCGESYGGRDLSQTRHVSNLIVRELRISSGNVAVHVVCILAFYLEGKRGLRLKERCF